MRSIKPLPQAVRSTLRSGVILFDLTRVVEELVFNSLDAGASKVSVFVGVGSCYVKVVDDGSGISRDGLVSLGERYVTSKLYELADLDAASGNFGFRGEALASISDVSLLEIVTKAHGKPNGYRKVIKGSKCLYLGIDDDRIDVGTTVVVRDLFYNQPVRRKHMQSSPKKVLHSVKKCVLRVALVHPNVSFSIVDIESEDELLSTHPSSSPLSLLISGFGMEECSFLHELNATDGVLSVSGYVSGPGDSFAVKALQYVYINSRFICKGPIHKLLNNLAASIQCSDPCKAKYGAQKGKRSRSQAYPAYILNISCPPSVYDLTFEPSKTHVEFKDWGPILAFIEMAIEQLWRKTLSCDILDEDLTMDSELPKKKHRPQNHQSSLHLSREHEIVLFEEFYENTAELKEQWTDYSFHSHDFSTAKSLPAATQWSDDHMWTSDINSVGADDCLLEKRCAFRRSDINVKANSLSSDLRDESFEVNKVPTSKEALSEFSFDYHEFSNVSQFGKDIRKPFLRSCSLPRSPPLDKALYDSRKVIESPLSFKTKRTHVSSCKRFDTLELGGTEQSFDCHLGIMCLGEASCSQTSPRLTMSRDSYDLTRISVKSFLLSGDTAIGKNSFLPDDITLVENSGYGYQSLSSDGPSVTSDPFEHFTNRDALRGSSRDNCRCLADEEEKNFHFGFDLMSRNSTEENCTFGYGKTRQEDKDHADSRELCRFLQQYNLDDKFSSGHSDLIIEERDWLYSDSSGKGRTFDITHGRQRDQLKYPDPVQIPIPRERSRRSHSAPPFYRQKKRFMSLNKFSLTAVESNLNKVHDTSISPDADELNHLQQSPGLVFEKGFQGDRQTVNKVACVFNPNKVENCGNFEQLQCEEALESVPEDEFIPNRNNDSINCLTKWKNSYSQRPNKKESYDTESLDDIFDISSGFLHLASDSLVPESISKNCLKDAKVLPQVDKKFIPIVAGGTLAVIDQHAADERIRLEELRHKVLSGEAKTLTYLDSEQELVLPETGYQLLQNYAEKIKDWGWICNIHIQASRSFKKNLNLLHRQPAVVTLLAVPCILGVNLTDVDLLEFLQQLADTDGSSTIPPSVLRVLNFKACRGAIMFGDSLLPSECSLIVEELKQTSLCFQCAHGRPTTVPLINLEALRREISRFEEFNDGSSKMSHGLLRHGLSLERASLRLSTALG